MYQPLLVNNFQVKDGEDVMINNEKRRTTCIIYFDVEKAFDKLWQKGLIAKMVQ